MHALTTWTRRASLVPGLAVAAVALLAGCHGSGPAAGGASARAATPAATTSSPPASALGTAPASAPASSPASAPASAPVPTPPTAAHVVYLADGGSTTGTRWHEPRCSGDCVLTGDATMSLHAMTWQSWGAAQAVGTGGVRLLDCTPNCAGGKLYLVPATVTLSRPVMVCTGGTGRWYWTRVSFTWAKGLPTVFTGDNAPANPFNYDGLASQAAASC